MKGSLSGKSGVAAVVLAAGLGSRFAAGEGSSKLTAHLNGKPLVRHVTEAALASRAGEIVVVTGHAAPAVREALGGFACRIVHNDAYAEGLAVSLKAAIEALPPAASGALILLGDMPLIRAGLIDELIGAFEAVEADAVVPVHAGEWGNPVLLSRSLFSAIAGLEGDKGARALLKGGRYRVLEHLADDEGIEIDVDTQAALEELAKGVSNRVR